MRARLRRQSAGGECLSNEPQLSAWAQLHKALAETDLAKTEIGWPREWQRQGTGSHRAKTTRTNNLNQQLDPTQRGRPPLKAADGKLASLPLPFFAKLRIIENSAPSRLPSRLALLVQSYRHHTDHRHEECQPRGPSNMSYWCCCCVGAGGGGGRRRDRVAEHFIGCLGHSRRHRGAYLDGADVGGRRGTRDEHVARGPPEVVARVEGYRVSHVKDDARRAGARRRPLQQVGLLRALLGREPQLLGLEELANP